MESIPGSIKRAGCWALASCSAWGSSPASTRTPAKRRVCAASTFRATISPFVTAHSLTTTKEPLIVDAAVHWQNLVLARARALVLRHRASQAEPGAGDAVVGAHVWLGCDPGDGADQGHHLDDFAVPARRALRGADPAQRPQGRAPRRRRSDPDQADHRRSALIEIASARARVRSPRPPDCCSARLRRDRKAQLDDLPVTG